MQHERHKCDTRATRTIQVQHEGNTSERWQHECNTRQHKCYTNNTSATLVRNFDFDNDTSENIFSHLYISYTANEGLQREEQFHSKNYLLEMPRSHTKMHLESAPQKLSFVMAKAISKSYTLDCSYKWPCTFPNSYT